MPIIILFLIRAYDGYKRKKISLRGYSIILFFLLVLTGGVLFNKQLFTYLESSHLTNSTPLSLFDVVQIAAIILLLYLVFRQTYRIEELQTKLSLLNQEIALRYPIKKSKNKKK